MYKKVVEQETEFSYQTSAPKEPQLVIIKILIMHPIQIITRPQRGARYFWILFDMLRIFQYLDNLVNVYKFGQTF